MPRVFLPLLFLSILAARLIAADPLAILSQPENVTEKAGGIASFVVTAHGSAPLHYQWFHEGAPLFGETRPVLIRAPLASAHAGRYTVSVSDLSGTVLSAPARLLVETPPPTTVDPAFRADVALSDTPSALLPLPDGTLLIATTVSGRLLRLRADGSLDPTWPEHVFANSGSQSMLHLRFIVRQPDGRILVGGRFNRHNDAPSANLIRLQADGHIDATFTPATGLNLINLASAAVQRDGRIVLATYDTAPLRLRPDGSLDASFRATPLPPVSVRGNDQYLQTVAVCLTPEDRILVARFRDISMSNIIEEGVTDISRLLPDGSADPSFTSFRSHFFTSLHATADGGALVQTSGNFTYSRPGYPGSQRAYSTTRLGPDGAVRFSRPGTGPLLVYPDGAFICRTSTLQWVRVAATGTDDPTFLGSFGLPSLAAFDAQGRILLAGASDFYPGQPGQRLVRLVSPPSTAVVRNPPRILALVADHTTIRSGETVTVQAAVVGSGPINYTWAVDPNHGVSPVGGSSGDPVKTYHFASSLSRYTIHVTAANNTASTASASVEITMLPPALAIVSQPTRVSTQQGRDVTLTVTHNASSQPVTCEWRRDGQLLPPPAQGNGLTYTIPRVTTAAAGTYTLTIRDALGGEVTTVPIVVTIDDSSRLINLSTLAVLDEREPQLISGFTITGTTTRRVLVRGLGPDLARFGVAAPLPDPVITLFHASGAARPGATSDNWEPALAGTFTSVGASPLVTGSADAALVADLPPGSYTVRLTGKAGQTGSALIEVYEADNHAAPMTNLATRAYITPDAPATAGFVIRGPAPKTILLRAVGPSLAQFGSVPNPLPDPRLTLRDSTGAIVAANEDWGTQPGAIALPSAFARVGAFPLISGGRDSALLVSGLPPGNYTATVQSAHLQSGVALLEIYESP